MKELHTNIAIHSRDTHMILKQIPVGTQLWMKREPNPKNKHGIGIYREARRMGFLPKTVCERIAPLIDEGKFVICVKTKDGPTSVKLVVAED